MESPAYILGEHFQIWELGYLEGQRTVSQPNGITNVGYVNLTWVCKKEIGRDIHEMFVIIIIVYLKL